MNNKAVVLLSGGLDSSTCLAIAKNQGFDCYTLSIDYGQKQIAELQSSKQMSLLLGAKEHKIVSVNLNCFGGSALTDSALSVPDFSKHDEIPITYVPARNTVFLSLALSYAETLGVFDIFIGANQVDYSGYPDCRLPYLRAFEAMANLATKASVEGKGVFKIHTPLLMMNKAEIVQTGTRLGLDYSLTVSCYRLDDQGRACGQCDSCTFRKKGFLEAGISDPTRYV